MSASEPSSRIMALIPAGLALVLVIIGLAFFGIGRHEKNKHIAMQTWPTTTITITSCGNSPFRRSGETQDEVNRITVFEYSVNGHPYKVTSTEYLGWASQKSATPVPYQPGQTVTGYYDPDNPQSFSLSREGTDSGSILAILQWVLFALSVPFWLLALKMLFGSKTPKAA